MNAVERATEIIGETWYRGGGSFPGPAWAVIARALADAGLLIADELDWRTIADDLYVALGVLEAHDPGGAIGWPRAVQPAIDAYEYATDARLAARGES